MKAIRGATTVAKDCPEDIRDSVRELLDAIFSENSLRLDEVVCIMLSRCALSSLFLDRTLDRGLALKMY